MTPLAIDRPLTDDERELLGELAVWCIAAERRTPYPAALAAVQAAAEDRAVELDGDAQAVRVIVRGKPLLTADRDWLSFHANNPGQNPMKDRSSA